MKPAWEPIILAMRPTDGTFAANALAHGVAGMNVDGCRIGDDPSGRWPANVVLDEEAGAMLDEQSGTRKSGKLTAANQVRGGFAGTVNAYGKAKTGGTREYESNCGGASRFFYCAKASKADRGEGNTHPTVKPIELMRWLVRLTKTPTGGAVLDPFCGSGSTGVACALEGRDFLGIEREAQYVELARARIEAARREYEEGGFRGKT